MAEHSTLPTVVLVHGGFVDGAGWEGVYNILKKDGYNVSIVQNPTASLADDVAATRQVIAQAKGPVVLVGHSYGGVVITEAGNDPKVSKLVYITAFALDKSEFCRSSSKIHRPERPCRRSCRRRTATYSWTRRNSPTLLPLMSGGEGSFHGRLTSPLGCGCARRSGDRACLRKKPSWYLPVTEDRMISGGSAVHGKACRRHGGGKQGKPRGRRIEA